MRLYPLDELYEEMAFIAFHFHWSSGELMALDHAERRRWVGQISAINQELDQTPAPRRLETMM